MATTNISKYTFNEIEEKFDIIKKDQGSNKVLLGDGTYGEYPDISKYVTTDTVETVVQEQIDKTMTGTIDQKVEDSVKEAISVASDSDIDKMF